MSETLEQSVPTSESVDMKYRFRKDKELGTQRPPVELKNVQVPTVNGLIDIIQEEGAVDPETGKPKSKALTLVLELMSDAVRQGVGQWVSDNENASQETFDPSKFTFKAIAEQPREDRRSSQISDEDWAAFSEDYLEIMPALTQKTKDQIGNALQVFRKKFSQVKTNKPVLSLLKAQLAIYLDNTKKGEDFQEITDMLVRKADMYLASDDIQQLVANL